MIRVLAGLLLTLAASLAFGADQSFAPLGKTAALSVTSTSTVSPIQVPGTPSGSNTQYYLYNDGPNTAFVAWCSTSTCVAVVPTAGSSQLGFPIPSGAVVVLSIPTSAFFAAITQSTKTATLYITPGAGN